MIDAAQRALQEEGAYEYVHTTNSPKATLGRGLRGRRELVSLRYSRQTFKHQEVAQEGKMLIRVQTDLSDSSIFLCKMNKEEEDFSSNRATLKTFGA